MSHLPVAALCGDDDDDELWPIAGPCRVVLRSEVRRLVRAIPCDLLVRRACPLRSQRYRQGARNRSADPDAAVVGKLRSDRPIGAIIADVNDPGPALRVTTWNVEWARPGTPKGERISSVLSEAAGVVVLTESETGLLGGGSTIEGGSEWGYPVQRPARRKLLAFSPGEWTAVDPVGSADLPPGRFVAGTTETAVGPIRVVGVCVPWHMAHVTGGRRDRRPWEDHRIYLAHLRGVLAEQPRPLVVAGDFNQRVPRVRQPVWAAELLAEAFDGLEIVTAGSEHGPLIDHVAISGDLAAQRVQVLPAEDAKGRLSDHCGVTVELTPRR